MIDNTKITSTNIEILNKSLNMINEHLEKEKLRGESIDKRTTMLITFIGIGASIVLYVSKELIDPKMSITILAILFFVLTIIKIVKTIYYTVKILQTRQIKRLSPDIINDIQELKIKEALSYEIKWKIWEYNHIVSFNSEKLFYFSLALRNLILAIFSILILACIHFIGKFITFHNWWFRLIQIILSIIILVIAIFSDFIYKKYSFWDFNNKKKEISK